jgi:alpha,alpha-trehalase
MNYSSLHLRSILILFSVLFFFRCTTNTPVVETKSKTNSPEELYGQLFVDVQTRAHIFEDSKIFVDCIPLYDADVIVANYSKLENKTNASIIAFVKAHFKMPETTIGYITDSSSIKTHITKLWDVLQRPADKKQEGSLIGLPYPYIVPGGRFREVYYWDSYFTMLGLQADRKVEAMQHMVDNFSFLIDTLGFIPNGNRTYYTSRSQPPFYAMMIALLAEEKGDRVYHEYLPYLEKEYAFWMDGAEKLTPESNTYRRVVRMPGGEILNRYWDDQDTPRPESFREDSKTAAEAVWISREYKKEEVYRNIRAAAESGWDFSSRWLVEGNVNHFPLFTIHTTEILPIDLNTLLYNLEKTIAKGYELKGERAKSNVYKTKSLAREKAIQKYFWNETAGFFMDVDFKKQGQTNCFSIAGMYPLFFSIATEKQADKVALMIQEKFLKQGGVVSTLHESTQQWDSPNGWAPLQWITIIGLRNYKQQVLANEIKKRWMKLNERVYKSSFKLVEKYNVIDISLGGGGGEYPNQDGFGWTNGVYQKLAKEKIKLLNN